MGKVLQALSVFVGDTLRWAIEASVRFLRSRYSLNRDREQQLGDWTECGGRGQVSTDASRFLWQRTEITSDAMQSLRQAEAVVR